MSHFDYEESKHAAMQGYPFYGLIMAAMQQADTANTAKLRAAWPEVWAELWARYNAPGGVLPGDPRDRRLLPGPGTTEQEGGQPRG